MAQMWEPIICTWEDAYSSQSRRSKDFTKHKIEPCIRRSIGFLIHENEKYIIIGGEDDREAQEAIESDDDCDSVTIIPKGMVIRIEELTARRSARRPENESEAS